MLALVLAAVVGASGVHGSVLVDPARPVCAVGVPCTRPDAHEVVAFWRGTRRMGTTVTDADGTFRVALPPGLYRVTLPRRHGPGGAATPRTIRIPRGGFASVTIRVDVGIR